MPWNGSKDGIPDYAVVGGYYIEKIYFARAEIDGGKYVGIYSLSWDQAKVGYDLKLRLFSNFEVSCEFLMQQF